ncbi:MAG: hypothetical protein US35_C0040G0007 [Parcubacteria group bacterium GW2011_GWA2_37_10]|nr:MAG: hypothetical protein US35_C0040G0007 [Parcubacteria group bacterium GW2011_GWA2_37_10]
MKSKQSCVRIKEFSEGKMSVKICNMIGLSKNWSVGISIAVMVGLHLWMMRGHSDHSHTEHKEHKGGAK